ncbi:hypothetical protein [Sedimentibacter sp. B4]|uniref:hypothetical protein n=1 Tax=Sedimentibacter sp. B4 TaxID=304766 RepID=UPI00030568AD|nr:hypothetical protein [Sedimentibacter sp. B4]
MLGKDIERKLTIFISSKIDERYKPIRHALKTLLMETGLVASVYAFEQEASSQNTQGAYLSEVSRSDLCIFLIDNADGVSDAVYKEHKQAINTGIHRLYFFCDERIKDDIPLHSELRQSGETIYRTIHEFAEIPKVAYERAIQDLLDWYRKRAGNLDSGTDITSDVQPTAEAHILQAGSLITLNKNVFARYSSKNILVRVLNPYGEKLFPHENDSSTSCDNLCADFLRMVIGRKTFNIDIFTQLKDAVLSEPAVINDIADVLRIRFDAIAEFFSGNLNVCLTKICEAYKLIKGNASVPEWLVNDIAIDMRNISDMLDQTKNQMQFSSEGQEILNQSAEMVYYPLLDRFAVNQKSKLLKEHFEMLTESPYTNRMGIMNGAFDDIASCFNIAVRFGSLTNIRITCNRYAEVLFTKYVDCKDVRLFRELARMYILEQDEKSLSKVVKAYRNSVDAVTLDDIEVIIESIETVPFKHKQFESVCLLLEHFGYYMSDEQYKKQEDIFFAQSNAWCEDADSRIVSTGYFILRTAFSIIGRSDNMHLLELALTFFIKCIWRFCDETLKVLKHIDYAKCTEEIQTRVMEQLVTLLAMENLANNTQLNNAIIAYRKIATIDTSALDSAVKEKIPAFYNGVYDLEIGLDNNPQVHLDKYINEARQRITPNESGVYYSSYTYNPCDIIRSILKAESIWLEADEISEMVTLIQDTILNENNQSDAKEGAILLAIYLRNTYPAHGAWEQFSELITAHEAEITNARFDSFFGGSGPNVVRYCYLLLKISLGCTSFEEVAIGFATMSSYSERDFIRALRYLGNYLSDADIDMVDNGILGIILNFVLSVSEDKHSDALYYAIVALIELLHARSYATAALIRLSYLMVNADSNMKVLILRKVSKMDYIKTDIGQHILQNGRTNNHYFVKKLANEITESIGI